MTKKEEIRIREEISNGGRPYLNLNVPVKARIPVDIAETMIKNTLENINTLMEKSLKSSEWYSKLNPKYISISAASDILNFKKLIWLKRRACGFGGLLWEAKHKNRKYVTIKENESDVNEIFESFKRLNYIDGKIFYGSTLEV